MSRWWVTFPLPKVSTMVEGKEVWGVTNINIESGGVELKEQHQQNDDNVQPISLL